MSVWVPPTAMSLTDGGLAGVGAFFGKVDVLRADGNVGCIACSGDRWQQYRGRKKGDFVAGVAGYKGQKGVDKGLGLGRNLVHLPIGGNEFLTGHVVGFLKAILSDGFVGLGDGRHRG